MLAAVEIEFVRKRVGKSQLDKLQGKQKFFG
jgi:hypothetical protein